MAETTDIAWCDMTFSPWIGCTKVSPGCNHCYAEALDIQRFSKTMGDATPQAPIHHWGVGAPRYLTKSWGNVVSWNRRAAKSGKRVTIFPSLCDPFDNEVPGEWREDFLMLVYGTPSLTWLLLTKRIGNAEKMLAPYLVRGKPMPNVWLGASIVNQEEADRDIPKLLEVPAAVRFVSYEPALGPVDFTKIRWQEDGAHLVYDVLGGDCIVENSDSPSALTTKGDGNPTLDWIIVGGESAQPGHPARPFDIAWARDTVRQCRDAGAAVFVKQLGSAPEWNCDDEDSEPPYWGRINLRDRAGADPAEWPEDLRVREFPR